MVWKEGQYLYGRTKSSSYHCNLMSFFKKIFAILHLDHRWINLVDLTNKTIVP